MKVLIIGSGGREHALAWKVASSDLVSKVFVAPGNAGTALQPGVENVALKVEDIDGLQNFAQKNNIGLTIVGPEMPLVAGIVDSFQAAGLQIFGPTAAAARLEGSKSFSKEFLQRHAIPTAAFETFTDQQKALDYIQSRFQQNQGSPLVIKADGLAAGKGVVIAQTIEQANASVIDMLSGNAHGAAGHRVVIEEFMQGEEASFICLVSGGEALPLATSQDHKARDDADKGPNTGGMGAYSPAPVVDATVHQHIMRDIIQPTINAMVEENAPFTGFLYAGLMIENGKARVVEFNVRLGDPETQPLLVRLQSDLVKHCQAALDGTLATQSVEWSKQNSVGVVMAAGGYPGKYETAKTISGIQQAEQNGCLVFHAGTQLQDDKIQTAGGRVLCVVAQGDSVRDAQKTAYEGVEKITWDNAYYRTDIGYRAIQREASRETMELESD